MARPSRDHKAGALVGVAVAAAIIGGGLVAKDQLESGAQKTVTPAPAGEILNLLNQRRAKLGLKPLKRDAVLADIARGHNRDMRRNGVFSHDKPDTFESRVDPLHRRIAGEVIAWGTAGFATPAGFVSLWFASPPHKHTILEPSLRRVGISVICGRFLGQPNACLATADLSS